MRRWRAAFGALACTRPLGRRGGKSRLHVESAFVRSDSEKAEMVELAGGGSNFINDMKLGDLAEPFPPLAEHFLRSATARPLIPNLAAPT